MSLLETFGIVFDSDASDVKKGAEDAERSVDGLETSIVDTDAAAGALGESFLGVVTSAQGMLASLVSVGAVTAGVIAQAAATDQLGKFSQTLGLNIEEVGAWSQAVARSGGSTEAFQGSIKSLTDSLTDFALTGGGTSAEVFARLGINAFDAGGKIKSAFDLLPEIADSFEGLSAAESAALGQKLGLDQGTILLLQQGKVAIDDLVSRQKALGVATQEDYEIAAKFNDQWDDTKQVFSSLAIATGATLLPAFTSILQGVESVVFFLAENEELVTGFFIGAASVITYTYLPAMISAGVATFAAIAPFIAIGAAVLAVGTAFALVYDDVQAFLSGQESVIGTLSEDYPFIGELVTGIADGVGYLFDVLSRLGGIFVKVFSDPKEALLEFLSLIGEVFDKILSNIPVVSTLYDGVKKLGDFFFGDSDEKKITVSDERQNGGDERNVRESASDESTEQATVRRPELLLHAEDSEKIMAATRNANTAVNQANNNPLAAQTSNSITTQGASYNSTTVSVGNVSVDARGGDSQEIASGVGSALNEQMAATASQYDDGVDL